MRIDAALNNGTAVNEMLADFNNGVYGAGVSWNASYTSRLHSPQACRRAAL